MDGVGLPINPQISLWLAGVTPAVTMKGYRNAEMNDYCKHERETSIAFDRVKDDEVDQYLISQTKLHAMVIMIGSEQCHDSLQYEMYLKLTQGRLSAQQMLAPLAHLPFFDYYCHLS